MNEFKEFERVLKENNYTVERIKGSHFMFSDGNRHITVNKDIKRIVAKRIIKEYGLSGPNTTEYCRRFEEVLIAEIIKLFEKAKENEIMGIVTLSDSEVISKVKAVRNGAFIRLGYRTEPTLKAAYKKAGYKIVKVTECTGRLGVNYSKIKSVIDKKAVAPVAKAKVDNYYWIIDNKIAGNTKTGKRYLRMTTAKNSNTKSKYYVFNSLGEDVSDTMDYHDLIIPSYFSGAKDPEPVRNIKLENVIRIDDLGSKFVEEE